MASGRFILPITEPIINSADQLAVGSTLTVYNTGTMTLASLFSDAGLTTPIANPQTANSAGRFYDQTTVIWADAAIAYDATVHIPDGETLTYAEIYLLGAATNTSGFAPINSPNFTGVPTAPTPSSSDNSNKIATTAFVKAQGYAPLNSPAFTGVPTAPTAAPGTNTTQIATTAFVQAATQTGAQSLTANGYATLPGGLIVQWGTTVGFTPASGPFTITFPLTFPTACFVGVATIQDSSVNSVYTKVISVSTTSMVVLNQDAFGSGMSAPFPTGWMAVGH